VLVFLAFGGITGREPSIEENLYHIVNGGKNERTQAAFNLSQKIAANSYATLEGEEEPWPVPVDLRERVDAAWDSTGEQDATLRFVLASLLAQLDDPEGVTHLVELLDLGEEDDPGARLRFQVLLTLGTLDSEEALPAIVRFADSEDSGLRSVVAVVLQASDSETSRLTLEELVRDTDLQVRANAAVSLARLGSPEGVEVLFELLGTDVYEVANQDNPSRFRTGALVSRARRTALRALARLGRAEDRSRLEAFREDPDLEFRGEVLDALSTWGA
jgi:HEAT repeat protein